jgi:hypothetical protein
MPHEQPLKQSDFDEWIHSPVTQGVFTWLEKLIQEDHRKWEDGLLTAESYEGTLQLNSEAIGRCKVLRTILELDFEQLQGELHVPEHVGATPSGESGPDPSLYGGEGE